MAATGKIEGKRTDMCSELVEIHFGTNNQQLQCHETLRDGNVNRTRNLEK